MNFININKNIKSYLYILLSLLIFNISLDLHARIHSAPIVIEAYTIRSANYYPLSSYRLFSSNAQGEAKVIPFQIDELNAIGDYVLDQGKPITKFQGNGIYDNQDQLVFMGEDVGEAVVPTVWKFNKPDLLYEIKYVNPSLEQNREGAVYLGIYTRTKPPKLSSKKYVDFNILTNTVSTSKFEYAFDTQNYLLSKSIIMKSKSDPLNKIPIANSSTFFLRADLKYFLNVEINQNDVGSQLEAYKLGPIRDIFRISFHYIFLKMNFKLGMYTEVAIYDNAVHLPAVIENPLNAETLNPSSSFYYGFSLIDPPNKYKLETNFIEYQPYSKNNKKLLSFISSPKNIKKLYWLSMNQDDRMLYMELAISNKMKRNKNLPSIYTNNIPGKTLVKKYDNDKVAHLGKSPVNLGLHIDLQKFASGTHLVSFRFFFDNDYSKTKLNEFKTLNEWYFIATKLANPNDPNKENKETDVKDNSARASSITNDIENTNDTNINSDTDKDKDKDVNKDTDKDKDKNKDIKDNEDNKVSEDTKDQVTPTQSDGSSQQPSPEDSSQQKVESKE